MKLHKIINWIIFPVMAVCTLLMNPVTAQDVKVHAQLDSTVIKIGDQVFYRLEVIAPPTYSVFWPYLKDTLINGVEIVKRTGIDTLALEKTKEKSYSQNLTITSFDSGYYAIPPVIFTYKKPGDTTLYTAESEALLLTVNTIAVDTTQAIKPIKGPVPAPYTLKEAMPLIIGALLLAAILVAIYYIRKRRKVARPIIPVAKAPALADFEIALRELEKLRGEKLWQKGFLIEYHTQLTDIIRQYINSHYGIHAHELTSEEIIESMHRKTINHSAVNKLKEILLLADLVKFAKEQPLPAEHDIALNNAIDFVKATLRLPDKLYASDTGKTIPEIVDKDTRGPVKPNN